MTSHTIRVPDRVRELLGMLDTEITAERFLAWRGPNAGHPEVRAFVREVLTHVVWAAAAGATSAELRAMASDTTDPSLGCARAHENDDDVPAMGMCPKADA